MPEAPEGNEYSSLFGATQHNTIDDHRVKDASVEELDQIRSGQVRSDHIRRLAADHRSESMYHLISSHLIFQQGQETKRPQRVPEVGSFGKGQA